jgi:hypothetical protein
MNKTLQPLPKPGYYNLRGFREYVSEWKRCPYCGRPIPSKYRMCERCFGDLERGIDIGG